MRLYDPALGRFLEVDPVASGAEEAVKFGGEGGLLAILGACAGG